MNLLAAAIAHLYVVFPDAAPAHLHACTCCVDPQFLAQLTDTPRAEVGVAQLDRYASKALTTMGSADELRYFWPRLAELAVEGQLVTNLEVVFGKLRLGGWRLWPSTEQAAIERFIAAALGRLGEVSLSDEFNDADVWLCAAAQAEDDVVPYLETLLSPSVAAQENLLCIWERNAATLPRGRLANAFWDRTSVAHASVVAWLQSTSVRCAVERAYAGRAAST